MLFALVSAYSTATNLNRMTAPGIEANLGVYRARRTLFTEADRTAGPALGFPAISAATCAPNVGPAATVRDGSRMPPSTGRSRHGEHPGARVSAAETLIGGACQQPRFAESDVRHSGE
jgi:hypothetical protein